jgi:hypothetical protein
MINLKRKILKNLPQKVEYICASKKLAFSLEIKENPEI